MFVVRIFLIKGILFGVWDLLQNSFDSEISTGEVKANIIKNNFTYFTWCSTPTHQH